MSDGSIFRHQNRLLLIITDAEEQKESPISTSSPKFTVLSVCVLLPAQSLHSTVCGKVHHMGKKKDQFRFGTIFKRVWVSWAQYSVHIICAQCLSIQKNSLRIQTLSANKKSNRFAGTWKQFKCVKRADFAIAIMEKNSSSLSVWAKNYTLASWWCSSIILQEKII